MHDAFRADIETFHVSSCPMPSKRKPNGHIFETHFNFHWFDNWMDNARRGNETDSNSCAGYTVARPSEGGQVSVCLSFNNIRSKNRLGYQVPYSVNIETGSQEIRTIPSSGLE